MTTAFEWRSRCIALRDAATRREREAKIALDEAKVFRETAEACRIEADKLESPGAFRDGPPVPAEPPRHKPYG